jgi:hypothetical protein
MTLIKNPADEAGFFVYKIESELALSRMMVKFYGIQRKNGRILWNLQKSMDMCQKI